MSPLNPYFLNGTIGEQRLVQDLINEQLKMFGQDVVYMPRKIVNKSNILKEVTVSKFDDSYRLEAYIMNYHDILWVIYVFLTRGALPPIV